LAIAKGEFIAFLDQDDLWASSKLEEHVARMRSQPQVDLTFSWFRYVDEAGEEMGIRSNRHRGTIDFRGLLKEFVIGATSNVVVRQDAIARAGGVDESIPGMYDVDLFLRIALLAPSNVVALPQDLMDYRRHGAQISRDFHQLEQEWELVLEKMRLLSAPDVQAAEQQGRSNLRRYLARLSYEQESYSQALRYVVKSFRDAPAAFLADRRNWFTAAACASGALFPPQIHRRLERAAGLRRSIR
jgi:hypothetical protein